jgi:hypothetical protein
MGNKVKYNLKNVHAAKLTETVSGGRDQLFLCDPAGDPRRGQHLAGRRG